LVSAFNIKLHFGQFPLTGGHKVSRSLMRLAYVWSHGDHHLLLRKRNLNNFIFG
jgi:hypothetical protein